MKNFTYKPAQYQSPSQIDNWKTGIRFIQIIRPMKIKRKKIL